MRPRPAAWPAYSVTKAALPHLTRILDVELRPLGIRVNAIAPQLLDSPRARATFPKQVLAHAVAPEAIAELKGKGVEFEMGPLETPVCHMAVLRDPDGSKICIHRRKEGASHA